MDLDSLMSKSKITKCDYQSLVLTESPFRHWILHLCHDFYFATTNPNPNIRISIGSTHLEEKTLLISWHLVTTQLTARLTKTVVKETMLYLSHCAAAPLFSVSSVLFLFVFLFSVSVLYVCSVSALRLLSVSASCFYPCLCLKTWALNLSVRSSVGRGFRSQM